MCTEGSTLSAIGRVLEYSAPAVLGRVKKGVPDPEPIAGAEPAALKGRWGAGRLRWCRWCLGMRCGLTGQVLGEAVGSQEVWIWTAAVEEADSSRWADFEAGDHSEATFLRLYERLPEAQRYYSDACPVYQSWLPPGRHIVGKGGPVNRNEGLHSVWRGKLNRLMRRGQRAAKSVAMLAYSLTLVCWRTG